MKGFSAVTKAVIVHNKASHFLFPSADGSLFLLPSSDAASCESTDSLVICSLLRSKKFIPYSSDSIYPCDLNHLHLSVEPSSSQLCGEILNCIISVSFYDEFLVSPLLPPLVIFNGRITDNNIFIPLWVINDLFRINYVYIPSEKHQFIEQCLTFQFSQSFFENALQNTSGLKRKILQLAYRDSKIALISLSKSLRPPSSACSQKFVHWRSSLYTSFVSPGLLFPLNSSFVSFLAYSVIYRQLYAIYVEIRVSPISIRASQFSKSKQVLETDVLVCSLSLQISETVVWSVAETLSRPSRSPPILIAENEKMPIQSNYKLDNYKKYILDSNFTEKETNIPIGYGDNTIPLSISEFPLFTLCMVRKHHRRTRGVGIRWLRIRISPFNPVVIHIALLKLPFSTDEIEKYHLDMDKTRCSESCGCFQKVNNQSTAQQLSTSEISASGVYGATGTDTDGKPIKYVLAVFGKRALQTDFFHQNLVNEPSNVFLLKECKRPHPLLISEIVHSYDVSIIKALFSKAGMLNDDA